MAVPATARYLVSVDSESQLRLAIEFASRRNLPWLVLGEGSNTVFTRDYDGLVILNRLLGTTVLKQDVEHIQLRVQAGENWHQLVKDCVANHWYGLQNLALIPGLAGAAPIQNIGAYGVELSQCLIGLRYFDIASQEVKTLNNSECQFAYRDSIFKRSLKHKAIITSIDLLLSKAPEVSYNYPALSSELESIASPTPQQVFDAVCKIRSTKLPWPEDLPNSGSFFKNPIVDQRKLEAIRRSHPGVVSYPFEDRFKLAAAWLIESAGWKSRSHHGIRVHQQQALVIINPERREGRYVMEFARLIQSDIESKFGLELEIEPQLII